MLNDLKSRAMVWTMAGAMAACAGLASGQLAPQRLYNGADRSVPVTLETAVGEGASLVLHDAATGEELARASVGGSTVDLAELFPRLWGEKSERVYKVQLEVDGSDFGSALVLQPLVSPDTAFLVDRQTMQPTADPRNAEIFFESDRFEQAAQRGLVDSAERPFTYSGLRVYPERFVRLVTDKGEMLLRLRPDAAPNTVMNFMHLVEGGFYTDIPVHRIVPDVRGNRFVIQFGDPTGTGSGGPGYLIDLEKTPLLHDYGVLSMARSGDPDSGGSQVFICLSRAGTDFLDRRYTAFAEVVEGVEAIEALASVPVGEGDRPLELPRVMSAELVPAPPVDQTPARVQDPTLGASPAAGEGAPANPER